MSKILFAILLIVVVVYVDSALMSVPFKNTGGKLKISIEYIPNNGECTEECKMECNDTCGQDLECRQQCYIHTCNCPGKPVVVAPAESNVKSGETDAIKSPLRFLRQQIQCSSECSDNCLNACDNKSFKCKEYCQFRCCPYSFNV